ncbi:MAG: hypothetical protein ACQEXN_03885 [Actinomycetota bacterium]
MTHVQQTTEPVRITRLSGPKLEPEDFARRLLAICTSLGIDARPATGGAGVEFVAGLEGPEDELTEDLVAILQARFHI